MILDNNATYSSQSKDAKDTKMSNHLGVIKMQYYEELCGGHLIQETSVFHQSPSTIGPLQVVWLGKLTT